MQDKREILAHYGLKNDDFVFDFSDGILKPHNQAIYRKIVKAYDSSNRVLIEQATGTGKSFLAMKLIKDYALNQDKKVLFVCPTEIIQDAFVGNCEEFLHTSEVDTCLYQGLHNYADKHYDLIIFDEAHRLGATVWGANAKTLMENNPEAKILGMSATLERQDGKKVDEILGVRGPVSRLTLPDAIQRNILPSPNYTLAKVNFDDDREFLDTSEKDLKERLKEAKKAKDNYTKGKILNLLTDIQEAKNRISECEQIPDILQKTLNTEHLKNGKFIVFCPLGADDDSEIDALKMEQIMQDAPKWFAGINSVTTYGVHSKYGAEHNLAEIKRFEEDNSDNAKLLFAVNMLNEGKHVKGIDGVLMFRKTSSNIIYLQQLGRVLSVVDTEEQPIVLDFVANLNYQAISDIKECLGSTGDTEQGDNENTPTSTDEYKEKDFTREFTLNIENLSTVDFIERLKENVYDLFDDEFFNEVMNKSLQFIKENGKDELLRSTKNTIMQDVEGNKYKLGAKWYYLLQSKLDGNLIFTKEQQQLFDKVMAEDEDLQKAGIEITAKEVIDNMFKHDWLMEDLIKYSKQYIVEFGKGEFLKTIHSTVIQDVTGNKYPLGKKWYQLITKDNFTEVRQDLFNKLIAEDEELQKAGIEVTAQEVIDNMFKHDWLMEDLIERSKQYIVEFGKEEFLKTTVKTVIQDVGGNKYALGQKWYQMLISYPAFNKDRQELFNKLMAEDEKLIEAGITIDANEVIDNMFGGNGFANRISPANPSQMGDGEE